MRRPGVPCPDQGTLLVGRQAGDELVHELAPGPEIVVRRAPHLGEAGHGALEGVAVQVGQRRKQDGAALVARRGGNAGLDLGETAAREGQANIGAPALRGQRPRRVQHSHLRGA